jgi:dipeptidyl aminopeptidase/acylaminoacyl peptidase
VDVAAIEQRIAFSGLPLGEIRRISARGQDAPSWARACLRSARGFRRLAQGAQEDGRRTSAAEAWLWAAAAYQAASFGAHFDADARTPRRISRCRRLARRAYECGLEAQPALARPVRLAHPGGCVHGYLRRPPAGRDLPVVVLLNGLDSVCEVEMHAFGSWLLARGIAVLALDLPADSASARRRPVIAVEELAAPIRDLLAGVPGLAPGRYGLFGVSFGGLLAARLLAGGGFRCAVAVSPPAWLGPKELASAKVRAMLSWTFAVDGEQELGAVLRRLPILGCGRPSGKLLLFQMRHDDLFDEAHTRAFAEWGGPAVEVRRVSAEHVGTSVFHRWLPAACDWLGRELSQEA